MRISIVALSVTAAAMLTLPLLPESWLPDVLQAPTGRVVPEMIGNGADAVGNFIATAAQAQEADKPAIDFSKLVRVNEQDYHVSIGQQVATEVLSSTTIRKVGLGGMVSEVKVVRTPSGTYSTDGIASAHVLYPGITVTPADGDAAKAPAFGSYWKTGFGWMQLPINAKGSTITFGRVQGGGRYITSKERTCIRGPGYVTCS